MGGVEEAELAPHNMGRGSLLKRIHRYVYTSYSLWSLLLSFVDRHLS